MQKNISSNQLFSDFFSKNVDFTENLPKKCEIKFLKFPHCTVIHYLFQSWSTRGRGRGGLSRASCSNINGRSPDPSASLSPVRIEI